MARLQSLVITILILSVNFSSPVWTQESVQVSIDARRCNGELQASTQEQIASCSALIDSHSFSGKTLAVIYSNRGIIWLDRSDFYRAVVDFGEAIALDPLDATSFYHRGLAKLKIGDTSGEADIAKAKELNPMLGVATPSLAVSSKAAPIERKSNDLNGKKIEGHLKKKISDHSKKDVSHRSGKVQRDQKGDEKKIAERGRRGREISDTPAAAPSQRKVAERGRRNRESAEAPVAAQPSYGGFIPGIPFFGLGIGFGHH